jgi:hypothetical protein
MCNKQHHFIQHIKRFSIWFPTPRSLWKIPCVVELSRICVSGSMVRTKSSGDKGSSWRNQLPCKMGMPAMPLRSMREEGVDSSATIQLQNRLWKPRRQTRPRMYSRWMKSKSLPISSLNKRAGIFASWNLFARFLTYKLPHLIAEKSAQFPGFNGINFLVRRGDKNQNWCVLFLDENCSVLD